MLIQRTKIYADFLPVLKQKTKFTSKKYIFVVTPKEADENGEWEGAIASIKSKIDQFEVRQKSNNKKLATKL